MINGLWPAGTGKTQGSCSPGVRPTLTIEDLGTSKPTLVYLLCSTKFNLFSLSPAGSTRKFFFANNQVKGKSFVNSSRQFVIADYSIRSFVSSPEAGASCVSAACLSSVCLVFFGAPTHQPNRRPQGSSVVRPMFIFDEPVNQARESTLSLSPPLPPFGPR
jgi:hypothetical protein